MVSVIVLVLADDLERLLQAIDAGSFRLVGQIPEDVDVVRRASDWLRTLTRPLPVADSARVR